VARLFFYNEQGEENTVHFVSQNKFVADLESLNMNTPSSVSCAAAIETEVIFLTSLALAKLNEEVFEWSDLMRKITEKTLFDKIKTRDKIFQKESKERYLSFLQLFPSVASSVQASHIASYLGMSQFTLSHIKGELNKIDFLRNSKN
jgi:CRP/FNR family transcriptional regulator, anaerobic regulatory protein